MAGRARFAGLWRHPDFLKLWTGQTVSLLGSEFTALAFPLTAILVLGATPLQTGILRATVEAPWFLLGLFAGVWVDRMRRRPILIGANLGRAALLGFVPLAAALGKLRIEQLYVIAFLAGVCTVFFEVAYQSYLPALVPRGQLVDANSKLNTSLTLAGTVGPGLAGSVIQLLTAPFAIVLDMLSFLISAASLSAIRTPEPPAAVPAGRVSIWRQLGDGLQVIRHEPHIRAFLSTNGTFNFFDGFIRAVYVLYLARGLGLSPAIIGLIFGLGSVGGVIGALVARPLADRWGIGPTIVGSALLRGASTAGIPLAGSLAAGVVPLLVIVQFLWSGSFSIYSISQNSTRQAVVPNRLLGRVTASFRVVARGAIPLGALLGGLTGAQVGLRATLAVGAVGAICSGLWLLHSPVRALHTQPAPMEEEMPA